MKVVRKIMVAVDFSDISKSSAKFAAALAAELGADLLLVNVINQRDVDILKQISENAPRFSFEEHLEENRQEREKMFERFILGLTRPGLKIESRILIGYPYKELIREIEAQKPDLLVMGRKGRSNLVDTIVGSCAQKMFRRCPIPLLCTP